MYWSNEHGWVTLELADFYSAQDAVEMNLPLDGQWVMMNDPLDPSWENNYVQFARLLCEINANVDISKHDLSDLCDSMDLDVKEINELFDRAHIVFENAKEKNIT